MILLEIKCPQLSKPEAPTASNQNSIGDRTEKKTLRETRLSRGASSPLARRTSSLFQLQQSQTVRAPLVPVVFSRWLSRWQSPHWRYVSGSHLGTLASAEVQRSSLGDDPQYDLDTDWICWLQWSFGLDKDQIGWLRSLIDPLTLALSILDLFNLICLFI